MNGAGVIGIEYASMFAALGAKVTVVEKRSAMLDFCDTQVVEALQYHLRDLAVTNELNVAAAGISASIEAGSRLTKISRRRSSTSTQLAT